MTSGMEAAVFRIVKQPFVRRKTRRTLTLPALRCWSISAAAISLSSLETPGAGCANRNPCKPSQAAAVTLIPGVVFSGTMDGRLRAYSTRDGKVLWEYNTAREFTTVNGVKANGGSMSNSGPAIVGGMLYVNSGYSHHGGILPGNVLLAFSKE